MFKIGDKVKRITCAWGDIKPGDTGIVISVELPGNEAKIMLEGREKKYAAAKFELVEQATGEASSCLTTPDPSKPYPDPEREAAEQQLQDLREYKRKMRDFLYGTSSD